MIFTVLKCEQCQVAITIYLKAIIFANFIIFVHLGNRFNIGGFTLDCVFWSRGGTH